MKTSSFRHVWPPLDSRCLKLIPVLNQTIQNNLWVAYYHYKDLEVKPLNNVTLWVHATRSCQILLQIILCDVSKVTGNACLSDMGLHFEAKI